jgi:hypothetical protein
MTENLRLPRMIWTARVRLPTRGIQTVGVRLPKMKLAVNVRLPRATQSKKILAPDGDDADCYIIHLPTALETQIRATVVNRRHMNNRFRIEENHYIKLDSSSDISVFKNILAFSVLRHEIQSIALGLIVGDNRTLEMHGLGHVGPLRKCIWAPTQEMSILSQTHYQRWFPNTMFVQYCNKAYIIKVESPAAKSIMMLHEMGHSGSKVAFFVCYQGSHI